MRLEKLSSRNEVGVIVVASRHQSKSEEESASQHLVADFDISTLHTHHFETPASTVSLFQGWTTISMSPTVQPALTPHLPYRSNSAKLSPTESTLRTPEDSYHASLPGHPTVKPPISSADFDPKAPTHAQRSHRKQEIQNDFRHLATIGFTSLVMGT